MTTTHSEWVVDEARKDPRVRCSEMADPLDVISIRCGHFHFYDGCFVWICVATPEASVWQARKHTHKCIPTFEALFLLLWQCVCGRSDVTHWEEPCSFPFLLWWSHAEILFQTKQKPIAATWLNYNLFRPPIWSTLVHAIVRKIMPIEQLWWLEHCCQSLFTLGRLFVWASWTDWFMGITAIFHYLLW